MIIRPQVGDWIGWKSQAAWYNPLSWLYYGETEFERKRYPRTIWNPQPIVGVTHAGVVTGERQFFEMTFPVGRFRTFSQGKLAEQFARGRLIVVRFENAQINDARLFARARQWNGQPYDAIDNLNLGLSGLLGIFNRMIVWIGPDKANTFRTCSPVAADILQFAGLPIPMDTETVDPAAPFNQWGQPAQPIAPWWATNITSQLTKESFA